MKVAAVAKAENVFGTGQGYQHGGLRWGSKFLGGFSQRMVFSVHGGRKMGD